MRIIIDWAEQEIYTEEKKSDFIKSLMDYDIIQSFERWLDCNYDADEIFDFSEERKKEVKEEYEDYKLDVSRGILEDCSDYTVINVESDVVVSIK